MKKIILFIAAVAALFLTPAAEAQNDLPYRGMFTFTNVASISCVSTSYVTNINIATSNLQFAPIHGYPGGVSASSPQDYGVWVSFKSSTLATNLVTFNFANCLDASTNYWTSPGTNTPNLSPAWSVSGLSNGTNIVTAFSFVNRTNFIGARFVALTSIQTATNNNTNLVVPISVILSPAQY